MKRTLTVLSIALIVALLAMLCSSFSFGVATWVIPGKVTDANTQAPIKDAEIALKSLDIGTMYKTKTDKDGEYLYRIPLGRYKLTVKVKGYVPQEIIEIKHPPVGDEATENFKLTPGQGVLMSELSKEEIAKLKDEQNTIKQQQEEYEKFKKMSGEMKALFDQAIEAKKAGQFDLAIEKLQQALTMDPKQPNILGHLADAYYQKGDNDTAVTRYKEAITIAPLDATLHTNLGNVYVKKGMIAEAQAEFEEAVRLDPANAAVNYYNVGVVMVNNGKNEEALTAFGKCVQADPNYAAAYYHLAMCQINKAMYAEAVASMDKYLQLAPTGDYAAMIKQMLPELKKLVGK